MKESRLLVRKLLLHDVSVFQLLIYALGVFIGVFVLIVGVQIFADISGISNGSTSKSNDDYIVLSRRVDGLSFGSQSLGPVLDELRLQPWVVGAAPFSAADFSVTASVDFAGRSMATALFLESVPDEFLESVPEDWTFDPSSSYASIPVILPRDYLALYNFGFAGTRGLPKIGENVLTTIPLRLSFAGNGHQRYFNAHVAGFTSRLNTIAVPQEVIVWGNKEFGEGGKTDVNRVIVRINTEPSDSRIKSFVKENNLEIGGDKALSEATVDIANLISGVVILTGLIIVALAIALLVISIFLLMHKSRETARGLLALGYYPGQVSATYTRLFLIINTIVLVLCVVGVIITQNYFEGLMTEAGLSTTATVMWPVAVACLATLTIDLVCWGLFSRSVNKLIK